MIFPDGVASDDLYGLLGVTRQATDPEVRTGWLTQVGEWHPDRNAHPLATARTQAINRAHEILSDAALRAHYNRHGLHAAPAPDAPRAATEEAQRRAADARWAEHEARWRAQEAEWAASAERAQQFQRYLAVEEQMMAAYRPGPGGRRDLHGALMIALRAVRLLPERVADTLEDLAKYSPPGFYPAPWPALIMALRLAVCLQDDNAITEVHAVLEDNRIRAPWLPLIGPARQSFRDASAILAYVRKHPGVINSRLGAELGQDQRNVTSDLAYWLAEAGLLRRERAGRSYALFAV